jgi:hypothetical protein
MFRISNDRRRFHISLSRLARTTGSAFSSFGLLTMSPPMTRVVRSSALLTLLVLFGCSGGGSARDLRGRAGERQRLQLLRRGAYGGRGVVQGVVARLQQGGIPAPVRLSRNHARQRPDRAARLLQLDRRLLDARQSQQGLALRLDARLWRNLPALHPVQLQRRDHKDLFLEAGEALDFYCGPSNGDFRWDSTEVHVEIGLAN